MKCVSELQLSEDQVKEIIKDYINKTPSIFGFTDNITCVKVTLDVSNRLTGYGPSEHYETVFSGASAIIHNVSE
jgi:hypothetical protein